MKRSEAPRYAMKRALSRFTWSVMFLMLASSFGSCGSSSAKKAATTAEDSRQGNPAAAATKASIARVIDEPFATLLPEAASRFFKLPDARAASDSAPLPAAGMSKAIKPIFLQWTGQGPAPGAAIVSPLAAADFAALLAAPNPTALSFPPLVIPFAGSLNLSLSGIHAIEYDYEAAYAAMGKKAARFMARAAVQKGTKNICGFVFQENFMRGRNALDAFVTAFQTEAGEDRLVIEELAPQKMRTDPAGTTQEAIAALSDEKALPQAGTGTAKAVVIVLAIDNAFIAESAAASGAKGTLFLVDRSAWGTEQYKPGFFRFKIDGDQEGLAKAAIKVALALAEGRPAARITKVPLRYGSVFPFPKIF